MDARMDVHGSLKTVWILFFLGSFIFGFTSCACPGDWLTLDTGVSNPSQSCFKIFSAERRTFDDSVAFCKNYGGYLVRQTTQTIHDELMPYVNSATTSYTHPNLFWIGLTDNNVTNGPWLWVGGSSVGSYKNFGNSNVNTPNVKDCAYISAIDSGQKWIVTNSCNRELAFICQRDINAPPIAITTAPPLHCPPNWHGYAAQQTCIQLFTNPKLWQDARTACKSLSGDLVRISNAQFNSFINSIILNQKGIYWIGLNDRATEGRFVWLDDKNVSQFTYWAPNMPNNAQGNENCVAIDSSKSSMWDDGDCGMAQRYICQTNPLAGTVAAMTMGTPSSANCGSGWEDVPNSDNCFKFSTSVLTWLDARSDCLSSGGDLATIANAQEQYYLMGRSVTFSIDFFWIGANDRTTENGWQWADKSPFAFLNWDDKQPDNSHNSDCAVMVQSSGRWDDLPCQNRYGYICKKKGKTTFTPAYTTSTTPRMLPGDVKFGCPSGWSGFRGSCYQLMRVNVGVDWPTANSLCSSPNLQGALLAITDDSENKFVQSLFPGGTTLNAWIGLQDPQENNFVWEDGTPVTYTNWNLGQPDNRNNEDCVIMQSNNGKWSDAQCSLTMRAYICKKNKSILPSGGALLQQGCQNNSIGYGAQCYNFINVMKNFNDAQKDCLARSGNKGNLATVDSGHLQAFLASQLSTMPAQRYWIGLSQNNALYNWKSNWPVSFTYWGKNHTGNERNTCVAMLQTQPAGLWVNYACNTNMAYICESPRSGFTTAATKPTITSQLACPTGWLGFRSLCYREYSPLQNYTLSWMDARNFCAKLASGGALVTIPDNATQNWLLDKIVRGYANEFQFWIGLNDRNSESGYVWDDGSPMLFANWAQKQPDDYLNREDCVLWMFPQNAWNDAYCYISNPWICQVPRGSVVTTPKTAPTGSTSPQCGDASWTEYNNNCYYVSPPYVDTSSVSWFDARQNCLGLMAELASIGSDDENGFITSLISKNPISAFWIGLTDLDSETYSWSDQSSLRYIAWALNEPNDNFGEERCVEMWSDGSWNDVHCQNKLGYICKKRPGDFTTVPTIPSLPVGGCPRDFVSLPSLTYCYRVEGITNDTRKTYEQAQKACELMVHKSTLASIHSALEEKFILSLVADMRIPVWIGLNDRMIHNQFMWVDNLEVSYVNWGPGQPDENVNDNRIGARKDCVDLEVRRNPGTWNDRNCNTTLAYICESKKSATFSTTAPNTTGCHSGYQRFRNSCYRYYTDTLVWDAARNICRADGADLATLSSIVEQAYVEIIAYNTNNAQFWIGLKYDMSTATFAWVDNWPVTFTSWADDEPKLEGSQNCVSDSSDGKWQVAPCQMQLSFVCELHFGTPPTTRASNFTGGCPDSTWFSSGRSCYHIESTSLKSWAGANAACSLLGANLTSIHSNRESHYLANVIVSLGKDVWIGLFKGQGSGFAWYDGTEMEYLNWGDGEPNDPESYEHETCVKIVSQNGTWADTDCTDLNAYICEKPQVLRRRTSPYPNVTSWTRGPGRRNNTGYTRPPFLRSSRFRYTGSSRFPRTGSRFPYTGSHRRTTPGTAVSSGDTGSGLSGGSVAGIVVGVLLIVAIGVVIAILMYRYYHGQSILPFYGRGLSSARLEYDNAAYSSSQSEKVNFSET